METKREIESTGSDVEEAIKAGLRALGVERREAKITVLSEGSRGLLGIGARPARVRLSVDISSTWPKTAKPEKVEEEPKEAPPPKEPEPVAETKAAPEKVEPLPEPEPEEALPQPEEKQELPEPEKERKELPKPKKEAQVEEQVALDPEAQKLKEFAPIACQTLEELLEKMGISGRIEHYIRLPQDEDDYTKLILNVRGRDLGALIGRRGEALNALQYLTRLIVGRELEQRVNLVVDVEGYRVRRERNLQQLSERMAERAVTTGQRQVLEPMSAAERRIVHVALRHHSKVKTESIGHGDSRKVTIFVPKEK